MLLALLLVLGGALWAFASAPSVACGSTDRAPHGNVLAASHHLDVGVVARPLRSPLPYASASRSCEASATIGVPRRTLGLVPTAHRHTPLYALFRVYRL